MLNPSAGRPVPPNFPGQDYGGTLQRAAAAGLGTILIRALAGGAASGSEARHPIGAAQVEPIGSGSTYRSDVQRAASFRAVATEARVRDLAELAIRFAISHPAV